MFRGLPSVRRTVLHSLKTYISHTLWDVFFFPEISGKIKRLARDTTRTTTRPAGAGVFVIIVARLQLICSLLIIFLMSTVVEEIAAVKADIRNLNYRITVAETGGRSEEYIISLRSELVELMKEKNILLTQRNGKLFTSIAYHLINIIIVVLIAKSRKYFRGEQVFPCF
jgi:hypothetical protein